MATQKIAYTGQTKDFSDKTTTTSLGGYKESAGNLKDPGKFTFDLVFNPVDPGQLALFAAYDANTVLTVRHQYKALTGFSAGPANVFAAEVESDPLPSSDAGDIAKASVSLRLTGPITKIPAVVAA